MRAYKNNKKYYPDVGLSRKNIHVEQSQQQYFLFVGTDIYFVATNYDLSPDVALIYGAYRWRAWYISNVEKYIFFFTTLDGSASILGPKKSMTFLHSVLFTVKMGSEFSLFGAARLAVSKIDPAVKGSIRKRYDMLHLLFPSLLYHHILPLLRLWKNSENALRTWWHLGYGENIFVLDPLLAWPTWVSNLFSVGRGPQIYKNWTSNGVTIGVDAVKSYKNTHL